ncbi:ATP-binding protein [Streptomyces sp. NPDC056930]|uniref:ATP-binding protein n=1 Tax=Streptomyces sp. NPDC056930 TaxID=3345967 RepID=UPI00363E189D
MTETQMRPKVTVEGPVAVSRYGSVGFRLADPLAPSSCRHAAADLLKTFQLTWVPGLVDDVKIIVSELVANACQYGGDAFPAGSLTVWHPNRWLVLTVHDKSPYIPYRETYRGVPNPGDMAWGVATKAAIPGPHLSEWAEHGRGLALVRGLAAEHHGELDWARDDDPQTPGKVARVKMLLPDVQWRNAFTDPWTGRVVVGRA